MQSENQFIDISSAYITLTKEQYDLIGGDSENLLRFIRPTEDLLRFLRPTEEGFTNLEKAFYMGNPSFLSNKKKRKRKKKSKKARKTSATVLIN